MHTAQTPKFFGLLLLVMLCACKPPLPIPGTPEYNELHGIINDGKTINQISLFNEQNNNHPKLRFAPEIIIRAETKGANDIKNPTPIRRGWASNVSMGMEITKDFKLIPHKSIESSKVLGSIGMTFIASYNRDTAWEKKQRDYFSQIITKSPIANAKQNWALYEYMITRDDYVSSYEYTPFDKNFPNNTGVPFRISCNSGSQIKKTIHSLSGCVASFEHANGVTITYTMPPTLLPYWKEVYTAINQFMTTTIQK